MSQLKTSPVLLDIASYPDDFSPCHRRVLAARNISAQQLNKSLSQLHDVSLLREAKSAANRIFQAIQQQEKIVIVGDYDADGATAMAVMVSVLRAVGAKLDTVVPNRVRMGYGLSSAAVQEALQKQAELVITVDNGISANDSVAQLKSAGVSVIITDHHLPPAELPTADFIVNPNHPDCTFPSKNLAGVGVAFYVMLALRQVYREYYAADTAERSAAANPLATYPLADLLPFVAIGTIADVVPLDFNNRVLVEQGLKRLRAGQGTPGLQALFDVAGLDAARLSATEIAFQVAPRLNAAGRIADMQLGVDCLLAANERLAMDYALELDKLNRERKTIENEMKLEADRWLAARADTVADTACLCLFDEDWNEGLIGILAARLKDKYHKTAFVFTRSGELLKASARAAKSVNLVEALNQLHDEAPQLLTNYGGHVKAAGLTLLPENLPVFSEKIAAIIATQLAAVSTDNAIYTDGELLPYELNVENAEFIKTLEPWGQTIPEPLFENTFYIEQIREVGKNHAQMMMIESASGQLFKGIAFDRYATYDHFSKHRCRVAYQLSVNEWRGVKNLSLLVSHVEKMQ